MPKDIPEIVGLRELVDLLNVSRRTPHAWQYRRILPEPDFDSVNGGRAWRSMTILKWAASTGRLPRDLQHLGAELIGTGSALPKRRGRRTDAEYAALAAGVADEMPEVAAANDQLSKVLDTPPVPTPEPITAPAPQPEPAAAAPAPSPEPVTVPETPNPEPQVATGTTTAAPVVFERGADGRLYARNVNP